MTNVIIMVSDGNNMVLTVNQCYQPNIQDWVGNPCVKVKGSATEKKNKKKYLHQICIGI